jgi:hypothetical protein
MRTAGDASSSRSAAATLCGIAMIAPRMLVNVNTAARNAGKRSGRQLIGTTTASMPACSKYGL